jgi:ubiquinone/menaquinone biosynthesis C-methylase UbiE
MAKRKVIQNSWQKVGKWYGKITEGEGHYYHRNVIIPRVLELLNLKPSSKVLDMGCGSGILGRSIDKNINYVGVDLSPSLIKDAVRQDNNPNHKYLINDASKLEIKENDFSDSIFILSLQNMKSAEMAIKNAISKLRTGGKLLLVLNHPAFRIPRQSSWQIDNGNKTEYRRINKYMSNMEIPINMNPSDRNSELTWSYHYPISKITDMLNNNGLLIAKIEEWNSDKTSVGAASKMENAARSEFPLFMAILGVKKVN